MEGIINFAKENYLIFLILGIVFLLALIGYFYDKYQHREIKFAEDGDNGMSAETSPEQPQAVEQVNNQPVQTPVAQPQQAMVNEQVNNQNVVN